MDLPDDIVERQIAYYRARAGEYEEWFWRTGRYDLGEELNARWFAEAAQVREALFALGRFGEALEFACGTGIWTAELVKICDRVTAVDAAPETVEINHVLSSLSICVRSFSQEIDALLDENVAARINNRQHLVIGVVGVLGHVAVGIRRGNEVPSPIVVEANRATEGISHVCNSPAAISSQLIGPPCGTRDRREIAAAVR